MNRLEFPYFFSDLLFRPSHFLLQAAQQFLILAFGEREIVVGQVAVFLLQLAFDFVPSAFEFEFSHSKVRIAYAAEMDG